MIKDIIDFFKEVKGGKFFFTGMVVCLLTQLVFWIESEKILENPPWTMIITEAVGTLVFVICFIIGFAKFKSKK
jgi:hypothetical protein